MKPPIVLLSGPPGAGKSSVARAFVQRFPKGLHVPVDDLREMVVAGLASPVPEVTPETERQFALARNVAAHGAKTYNQAGFAVVVDDVIGPLEAQEFFAHAHKVLLLPAFEVCLKRNAERRNKNFDTALLAPTIAEVHAWMRGLDWSGWLVLDSGAQTLEASVDALVAHLS